MNKTYQHWQLNQDNDKDLWLYFDKKNSPVNTIDREVMEEFSDIISSLPNDIESLIITSKKKNGFIAGADISQFTHFKDIPEATLILEMGQHMLAKLEALKIPTIAAIEGFCLGGGLELALACRYRIAEENARLGLPEVRLGIHPGWGGTVRLPRKIGGPAALNLILNGHTVTGSLAAKLGFVDAAVPKRQLLHAIKYYCRNKPTIHQATFIQSMTNKKIPRQIIAQQIRRKLKAKVNPLHYPAPYHVIDNWELEGVESDKAYEREAKSCAKLFFSETCHNLVRDFFLQERLKGLGKQKDYYPTHIHVIGAGTMGGDIAAWCALQGFTVTLQDIDARFIAPAIKRASILINEKLKKPFLVQKALDRLIPDLTGEGVKHADLIIEAVVEDLAIKQKVFKKVEAEAKPDAILATNTSSIPLDEINRVLKNPGRLVGIHYFNPVAKMQLIEVVQGEQTDPESYQSAISFVRKIDRLPLPVKSSPGFLVNRILLPYMLESMELLNEGVPMVVIDKAMVNFGMPMGPITLADTVGLDVCLSVAKNLSQYFDVPIPKRLTELVSQNKLGKKTGEGFYRYDKSGKQIKPEEVSYDKPLTDISNRLVLRMLNESFACLREGVVADADLLDAGMIFGTGFAPFRGGPIHYAKTEGIDELYQQFIKQQQSRGNTESLPSWERSATG